MEGFVNKGDLALDLLYCRGGVDFLLVAQQLEDGCVEGLVVEEIQG